MLQVGHLPFVSGLHIAGVIVDIGLEADSVKLCDRVLLNPNQMCGECTFCREGSETLCKNYSLYRGGLEG